MAMISACAVGSLAEVTRLAPSAMILPSHTTNAANGPPRPERAFSVASAMARRMYVLGSRLSVVGSRAMQVFVSRWWWETQNRFSYYLPPTTYHLQRQVLRKPNLRRCHR